MDEMRVRKMVEEEREQEMRRARKAERILGARERGELRAERNKRREERQSSARDSREVEC
jgi:hypothetical protein